MSPCLARSRYKQLRKAKKFWSELTFCNQLSNKIRISCYTRTAVISMIQRDPNAKSICRRRLWTTLPDIASSDCHSVRYYLNIMMSGSIMTKYVISTDSYYPFLIPYELRLLMQSKYNCCSIVVSERELNWLQPRTGTCTRVIKLPSLEKGHKSVYMLLNTKQVSKAVIVQLAKCTEFWTAQELYILSSIPRMGMFLSLLFVGFLAPAPVPMRPTDASYKLSENITWYLSWAGLQSTWTSPVSGLISPAYTPLYAGLISPEVRVRSHCQLTAK